MVPLRTISTSMGRYLRCGQLPIRRVRFLFIAMPIGNLRTVGG